ERIELGERGERLGVDAGGAGFHRASSGCETASRIAFNSPSGASAIRLCPTGNVTTRGFSAATIGAIAFGDVIWSLAPSTSVVGQRTRAAAASKPSYASQALKSARNRLPCVYARCMRRASARLPPWVEKPGAGCDGLAACVELDSALTRSIAAS